MYVSIYLSMYLCIYVSMYLCIYVSMIYVSMYLCIYVRTYVCMYAHSYILSGCLCQYRMRPQTVPKCPCTAFLFWHTSCSVCSLLLGVQILTLRSTHHQNPFSEGFYLTDDLMVCSLLVSQIMFQLYIFSEFIHNSLPSRRCSPYPAAGYEQQSEPEPLKGATGKGRLRQETMTTYDIWQLFKENLKWLTKCIEQIGMTNWHIKTMKYAGLRCLAVWQDSASLAHGRCRMCHGIRVGESGDTNSRLCAGL